MNLPSSAGLTKSPAAEERPQQARRIQETTTRQSKVASSFAVNDVEYDDDYFTFEHFNGIETMSQTSDKFTKADDDDIEMLEEKLELERRKSAIREYSIDSWNGSPGLTQWGYSKNSET
jgi:hypothetical protein